MGQELRQRLVALEAENAVLRQRVEEAEARAEQAARKAKQPPSKPNTPARDGGAGHTPRHHPAESRGAGRRDGLAGERASRLSLLVRTPDTCVVERHARRGKAVPAALLDAYAGVLVTDCYAAYHALPCRHQRGWVHLLRDLQELVLTHPDDPGVRTWVRKVRALYRDARRIPRQPGYAALALATPYLTGDTP